MTWRLLEEPCPDPVWCKRYGSRGQALQGWMGIPLLSPAGEVVGLDARNIHEKKVRRTVLPQAEWHPVWIGVAPRMKDIWDGSDVWIVEGPFDLFALEWAVSSPVLAAGRAKLTPRQVEFLRRFLKGTAYMVFDNDEAGQNGTFGYVNEQGQKRLGALQFLERAGVKADHIKYDGKDPGDIWDRGGEEAVQAAFPYSAWA